MTKCLWDAKNVIGVVLRAHHQICLSNDRMVPRICNRATLYQVKNDTRLLLARMKDKEVCANNCCHVQP